ncbi:hypothetical protein [Polyangium jinanense]|uniref:Uncharacterized protein n=1 Tax=Polyangium jinanense TaxID=2829994 RepID=A0A9X3XCZ3_9BACT|nr:hypothetical protein [Polyangium jinanense]MDC3960258.1 hypothetical protein [Polyangium jinanense]MDC3988022.1 hypothetical protein [Polyangium jinanense]
MSLTRLHIARFPGLAPGTELRLVDPKTVLRGPRTAETRALLRLAAMATAFDFTGLEGEAFELGYELTLGRADMRVRLQNAPGTSADWCCEVTTELRTDALVYRLECIADPRGARAFGAEGVFYSSKSPPFSPFEGSFLEPLVRALRGRGTPAAQDGRVLGGMITLLNFPLYGGVGWLDEGLGAFDVLTGAARSPRTGDAMEPPRLAFDERPDGSRAFRLRGLPITSHPVSEALLDLARKETYFNDEGLWIERGSIPLFLRRFVALTGFDEAAMLVRRDPTNERTFGPLAFRFRRGSASVGHEALSFGEKRLLAIMHYLELPRLLVIAENLGHGLTPAWREACKEALGSRRALLWEP